MAMLSEVMVPELLFVFLFGIFGRCSETTSGEFETLLKKML